jgi:hypothetical protein
MQAAAHPGAILLNFVVAGVLAFIIGGIALMLMQRAIHRNMMTVGGTHPYLLPDDRPRRAADAPLELALERPAGGGRAGHLLWRHVVAHATAGLVFAIVAAILLLRLGGLELLPLRTAVVTWAYAWPTVLVLGMLIGPDRSLQGVMLLGYFGVLAALCVIAAAVGTTTLAVGGVPVPGILQPAMIWLLYAAPTCFLLLFLNRTIRTIGPLILIFVFILLTGAHVSISLLSYKPVLDVGLTIAVALGIGGHTFFWLTGLVGLMAALWPAWRAVAWLRDRYAAKRTSDLLLTSGTIWMIQAAQIGFSFLNEQGLSGAALAIVPLVAWRLTLSLTLRGRAKAATERPPIRLLLLRVFGFGRRSRRLLDLLGARWRLIGSIDLIAAPDLASRTVEPSTFLEFVRGRLERLFIRSPDDLAARFASLDHRPDPDARFRVNQLFCADDTWRSAAIGLMEGASLVVMDLRGFGPHRRGCVYEIETLLDTVPIDRLVFVIDRTTDRSGLETVLFEHWKRLDMSSPNVSSANPVLRLLEVRGNDTASVRELLAIASLQT